MTHYAIIEQSSVSARSKLSASRETARGHTLVYQNTYASGDEFGRKLVEAIKSLHALADTLPKVLIISAHGIPLTGTNLQASDNEQICLWNYKDHFTVMPPNLVIYVSACFGGYPAMEVIQGDKINTPYVIGPLVDILSEHANQFQRDLLDLAGSSGASRNRLFHLIHRFNNKPNRRDQQYGGRQWLLGMYDTCGNFFPRRAIGGQLAAPVESRRRFLISEFVFHGDAGTPVACIVQDDRGKHLQANLAPLLHLAKNVEDLIGLGFSATYQSLAREDSRNTTGQMPRIHILKARRR